MKGMNTNLCLYRTREIEERNDAKWWMNVNQKMKYKKNY